MKMEMAHMGVEDGDNPYRKSERTTRTASLTDANAADEYARLIGDE